MGAGMSRALLRLKQSPATAAPTLLRLRKPLLKKPVVAPEAPPAAALPQVSSSRPASQRLTEYAVLMAAAVAVTYGYAFRHSDAFVPYEGAGYYLGIAGGVGILLQLFYGYAKRLRVFHNVTASRAVFHLHMMLGLGAPILILYHCKFSWGARNSNVALIAMLLVVASGLAGRIVRRKIQAGLRDRAIDKDLAQARAEYLRDILDVDGSDAGWLVARRLSALTALAVATDTSLARQLWVAIRAPFIVGMARLEFARLIRGAVIKNATLYGWSAEEQIHFRELANRHVTDFLRAYYTVPPLVVWERLLSFWRLLHVPLFYFLVLAGLTHVVAVHWY